MNRQDQQHDDRQLDVQPRALSDELIDRRKRHHEAAANRQRCGNVRSECEGSLLQGQLLVR